MKLLLLLLLLLLVLLIFRFILTIDFSFCKDFNKSIIKHEEEKSSLKHPENNSFTSSFVKKKIFVTSAELVTEASLSYNLFDLLTCHKTKALPRLFFSIIQT